MPRCGSRNCEHCSPRGAEERSVLDDVIERIRQEIKTDMRWTSVDGTTYFEHGLDWHDDFHEPWFLALANAYEAGMRRALAEVEDIRRRYDR